TLLNSATGGRTQMVSFAAAGLMVAFLYFLASAGARQVLASLGPCSADQSSFGAPGDGGLELRPTDCSWFSRRVHCGVVADVTQILIDIEHGDRHAADQLLSLVYDELRRLAVAS